MRRSMVTATVVSSLFLFFAASAFAGTGSPWWHLVSASQPSYVQPGTAKQQVWQLTVSATGGKYELELNPYEIIRLAAGETPAGVQAAIESSLRSVFYYPPGPMMEVTARSGPYNQYEVYEIKLVGELTYTRNFELSTTGAFAIQSKELTGGLGTAVVKEVSRGRPDGVVVVTAVNLGDGAVNPETQPVTVTDKLPAGLEAVGIEGVADENFLHAGSNASPFECSLKELSCTFTGKKIGSSQLAAFVEPYEQLRVKVLVKATGARTGAVNEASVTGGGAPAASVRQVLTVSGAPVPFGASTYEMRPEEAGGGVDTQAGSHPFQLTTTIGVNTENAEGRPVALTKDLYFDLPPGLVGNPHPFAQCTLADFLKEACPLNTVIGVSRATLRLNLSVFTGIGYRDETTIIVPLYNLEPAVGEPARFGFIIEGEPVLLTTSVRTGGDYGVTVTVRNITQAIEFQTDEVTFWGVPGDTRHNISRGEECLGVARFNGEGGQGGECAPFSELNPPPLLALPTSCSGPLRTTVQSDSWLEPQNRDEPLASTQSMPALDGCNRLPFEPSIRVAADGSAGSTPTGLNVDVHVDQASVLSGKGLAESNVRGITVALPEGVSINPAGGGGLEACSDGLVGFEGFKESPLEPGVSNPAFTGVLPEPLLAGVNFCANSSKIGTVTIRTPLLPNAIVGYVYLAAQEANPFGSLVAMYIVAKDPVSGTLVKLPGVVHLTETGQIVSTFENNPQLSFEDAELHFFGGERAPLASPAHCGTYTTNATYTPWSGGAPVSSSSSFEVKTGPNGGPCPGANLPFAPSLTAGTTSNQAGGFSPFTMTMSREDGQQSLKSVEVKTPQGMSGLLSGVVLCPEPQASQGACGPDSLIGETTVSVGLGGTPFTVTGGKVYITGPYRGAPFGLSIVNPAKAGPFDLENTKANHPACDCLLVRAKIEVDPITAALTVTSDSTGPFKIPTILEGIPLQIKHVNVTINRPGFTFNPTNCEKMLVGGSLQSAEGASQALTVPFQATNCAVLGFKPGFKVSTSGKTSRANGASLTVKLTYPKAPFGSQANIKSVKVDLPKQLPSRLTTLQKACTAAQFQVNPAGCPAASIVGHATAITPLIPVPLSGPAYFVSYGGAKFPELVIALQGYGVTVDLHGETFINKAGITSSTFKTVPDAPVGSFELTLPQGKYSALAANGNLCKSSLKMPTMFTAQNGMVIKQSTPITATGCGKAKHARKAGKRHRRK
jgi:hypothetical protein